MKSVMQHSFANIPQANIPRSVFNLSHGWKGTIDFDYLIPVTVFPVLPGDTFETSAVMYGRLNTLLAPLLDNIHVTLHWFYCPNRLLWENWQRFCGERDPDPDSSIAYTIPQVVSHAVNGFTEGSLWDNMGLPTQIASLSVSALPSRMYSKVYNDWYRAEQIIDSVTLDIDDGPDTESDYVLQKRGKRHDYLTACLPDLQLGDEVELPLGTVAPVTGLGKQSTSYDAGPIPVYETGGSAQINYSSAKLISNGTSDNYVWIEEDADNSNYPGIYADLSAATSATISELREAIATQQFLELDQRAGTRYTELILAHFGVVVPDFRVQRSEYLGGGTSHVNVVAVPQTESSDASTPQATLTAYGTFSLTNVGFVKSFVEHGYVMGIASCTADLTYQECLDRDWSKTTRYDIFWPMFQNISEQAVLTKEVYCDGTASDDVVFGYNERYSEYMFLRSKITGALRSNAATPLDSWHLSQEFGATPTLNQAFIESATPGDRVVATPSEPHFLVDAFFDVKATRPMAVRSVPGLKRL